MTTRKLLAIAAVLLFVTAYAMAAPGAGSAVTMGQFATQVVAALGQDARDIEAVKASLRSLGLMADFDAMAPLSTGMAARFAGELGVKVTRPLAPTGPMSAGQATALAVHIAGAFVDKAAAGLADPPDQCLSSENRGTCVSCCKEATGLTGQYCGRFCHANVPPPPSPDEPQP